MPATTWGAGAATAGLGLTAAQAAQQAFNGSEGPTTLGIPNNWVAGGLQALGGLAATDAVEDAYSDVANQYLQLGAPSRARFEGSFAPGFDITKESGYQGAMDNATNTFLRAASAGRAPGVSAGNPMDNPGAWAETLKYVMNSTALPQLNTYRSQNSTAGQLGTNIAGTGSLGQAGASGSGWEAIGAGIGTALTPQNSWEEMMKRYGMGVSNPYLNIGGMPYGGRR